jgi:hypothetical protein
MWNLGTLGNGRVALFQSRPIKWSSLRILSMSTLRPLQILKMNDAIWHMFLREDFEAAGMRRELAPEVDIWLFGHFNKSGPTKMKAPPLKRKSVCCCPTISENMAHWLERKVPSGIARNERIALMIFFFYVAPVCARIACHWMWQDYGRIQ